MYRKPGLTLNMAPTGIWKAKRESIKGKTEEKAKPWITVLARK